MTKKINHNNPALAALHRACSKGDPIVAVPAPVIKWEALIKMIPDFESEIEGAFGVVLSITRHNWQTGVHTEFSTAGVWGFEPDTEMAYVLDIALQEFETLKLEYPGTFDLIVVDAATPARFVSL